MTRRLKTIVLDIPSDVMLPLTEIAKLAGLSVNSVIRVALATESRREAQESASRQEDTQLIAKLSGLLGDASAILMNCPVEQLTLDQLNALPAAIATMNRTLEEQRKINRQLIEDITIMEDMLKATKASLHGIYTAKFEQAVTDAQVVIEKRTKRTPKGTV